MGFYSLLKIAEMGERPRMGPDPDRPVFLRFVSDNRVPAPEVDRFVGIVEKHIVALNELARERLVAAIIEAMANRSEEHTSELQSLMRISYAVFCLKNKKKHNNQL